MAGFVVVAPYLSTTLKQGYSVFSQLASTSLGVSTITGGATATTSVGSCSSAVAIKPLTAPDIANGSADVAYPPDYCTLAQYALSLINTDRAANGTGPVALDFNQAAQQHADSMIYYRYFSHFDTQGYKPYMRYTLLGGTGADYENIAYQTYGTSPFGQLSALEGAINNLEHLMVYNDAACCNNGHRDNILNPLHNYVSIGISYNSTYVFFDEEFQNYYINLNLTVSGPSTSSPYYVSMQGTAVAGTPVPGSVYVFYDGPPAAQTRSQLNAGPHEYTPGTFIGGVLPRNVLGTCNQFLTGTTVCADKWAFGSGAVDIAFPLEQFVRDYGPGVYTLYLITGPNTDYSLTTISVFVT